MNMNDIDNVYCLTEFRLTKIVTVLKMVFFLMNCLKYFASTKAAIELELAHILTSIFDQGVNFLV